MPHQGTSNEYPDYMFLWRIKKNISASFLKKSALPGAMIISHSSDIIFCRIRILKRDVLQISQTVFKQCTAYSSKMVHYVLPSTGRETY